MKFSSTVLVASLFNLFFAFAAQAEQPFDARAAYEALPVATEVSLNFTNESGDFLLGMQNQERSFYDENGQRTEICRKTAPVIPNPTFKYTCYRPSFADYLAEGTFKNLGRALIVKSTPHGKYRDVEIREVLGHNGDTLCQSYTLSPETTNYVCFKRK